MKKQLLALLLAAGLQSLTGVINDAHATTYSGNGNVGFNGAVGGGMLSVTDDGSGGFIFSFALGNSQTNLGGNDIEIYVDNGTGNGIGTDTSGLTDTADGGRKAASEYSGTLRSTLNFNGLMSPQYDVDLSINNANVFQLVNNGSFVFNGGSAAGGTGTGGVTYAVGTNTAQAAVLTADIPAVAFGLAAFSGATLKFVAILISETGYSSNEATVPITGSLGYGNTQTIGADNTFTAAVPEPSTWAVLLIGGLGALSIMQRFNLRAS